MKVLSITWKDMQILFKDRGALALLFLLPFAFIFIFSGALGQIGAGEEDKKPTLPVANLDRGGVLAEALLTGITEGGVALVPYDLPEAEEALWATGRSIDRVLVIPQGFSQQVADGQFVTLRLINHPEADASETEALRLVIDGVAQDMALQTQLITSLQRMAQMQAGSPQANDAFSEERIVAQAQAQFQAAQSDPLISIRERKPGPVNIEEQDDPFGNVTASVIGFAVFFIFLTSQSTARSIYEEKKVGSFRRLLAAPISRSGLLAGKGAPNFFIGILQAAVIFAFGLFILPLVGMERLSTGGNTLAVLLVVSLVALCSSALGILIAALARTEGQIGGLGSLVIWAMGIVGGSFVPLYLFDDPFISNVGQLVPVHWANQALYALMVRSQTLVDVLPELAVLAGFTAVFLIIGIWRFDFD